MANEEIDEILTKKLKQLVSFSVNSDFFVSYMLLVSKVANIYDKYLKAIESNEKEAESLALDIIEEIQSNEGTGGILS